MITILLLVVLVVLFSWYFRSTFILCSKLPNHLFIDWEVLREIFFGNGPQKLPPNAIFFQRFLNLCEKHKTEGMVILWLVKPMLLVYGPEAMKFFSNEVSLTDKADLYNVLKIVGGNGIFLCKGEENRRQRSEIQPAFYTRVLKDMVPLFNDHAKSLVQILADLKSTPTYEMESILKDCTLRSFFDVALEFKADSEENGVRMNRILSLYSKLFDKITKRVLRPWLHFDFTFLKSKLGQDLLKTKEDLFSLIEELLQEIKERTMYRKETRKSSEVIPSSKSSKKSLAEILMDQLLSNDSSLDLHYCITQLVTLIEGGFHTTSITLKWGLWLLGLHQDVQEKAYKEIISVTDGEVDYEDARQLTYLGYIIKETLRLYPPGPIYGRKATKEIYFGDYTIPKNMCIWFFPYGLHRNSEIYPDPESFNPDRFAESESNIKSWMHIPFAGGVRACIGINFAMLELKILLAHILRNFKVVTLGKREDIAATFEILLSSVNEPNMQFIPR